ncbi:MAG: nucleotide exchange factor GrpE [Planctomycetes bacterium]|nr:nucleotide exchange factor GrpE [Planctomycetota bacterium]
MTKSKRPEDMRDDAFESESALDPIVADLEKRLADAQTVANDWKAKHDEAHEKFARTLAEADNARKRGLREIETARLYAAERIAKELLQVTDNLRRALDGVPPERADDPLAVGVKMVEDQLVSVLANHGVKPMETLGQPFDPNFHEAIATDERGDVPPNTVVDELVRGWKIHDRLLRAAMVRVSKAPAAAKEG